MIFDKCPRPSNSLNSTRVEMDKERDIFFLHPLTKRVSTPSTKKEILVLHTVDFLLTRNTWTETGNRCKMIKTSDGETEPIILRLKKIIGPIIHHH